MVVRLWNRGESGQRERQGKGAKAMGSSSRRPATGAHSSRSTGSLLRVWDSDGKHPIKYDVFNADALIRKATPEVNICSHDEKKEPSPFYRNLF